jgi:uncharacterized membrane protein YtjA (UPF0391 family)
LPLENEHCETRRNRQLTQHEGDLDMLRLALLFFIISLVAAVFGFTGIAVATAGIAKILFFIFLVLFLIALVTGMVRRPM